MVLTRFARNCRVHPVVGLSRSVQFARVLPRSGSKSARISSHEGYVSDMLNTQQCHRQPSKVQPKTAMGRTVKLEETQVVLYRIGTQALFHCLCNQDVISVLTLRTCGYLQSIPQQVVALHESRIVLAPHVIERQDSDRILRYEQEFVSHLFPYMLCNQLFTSSSKFIRGKRSASRLSHGPCVGHRDAAEWDCRDSDDRRGG